MAENFEHGWKESNKLGHVSAPREIESRGRILNCKFTIGVTISIHWGKGMHLWRSVKGLVHIGAYIRLLIRFSGYWKFVLDTPGAGSQSGVHHH